MVEISIIIVNYNTANLTCNCIESIKKYSTVQNYEIIVVDNASDDLSNELISSRHPDIIFIQSNLNLGFGPANNLASKKAKGDYLFFLNSDTLFIEDSIKKILNFLEGRENNKNEVFGFNLLDENLKNHYSFGKFPSLQQEIFEFGLKKIFKRFFENKLSPSMSFDFQMSETIEVDYVVGADLLISKDLFSLVEGFDEDFFLYYEETELCFRLKRYGVRVSCSQITQIIHLCGQSSKVDNDFNEWLFSQMIKSKWLFFEKCYGKVISKTIIFLDYIKQPLLYKKNGMRKVYKILKSI